MDRRIETRVIDTAGAAKTTLVQKDGCELWWITLSLKGTEKEGRLKIYDGFDAAGKLEWSIVDRVGGHYNFVPPIPCDYGITVWNNADVETYTVAYRGKGWPKEPS